MTVTQETILYIMFSLHNQNQAITIDVLKQSLALLGCDKEGIIDDIIQLSDMGLVISSEADRYQLTDTGHSEASRIYKAKACEEFNGFIDRAASSKAYLDFCAEAYGYRMPMFNMMDKKQLDFVFDSIPLSDSDTVLEIGCGTGNILGELIRRYRCYGIGIDQIDPQGAARDGGISYIKGDLDGFLKYQITPSVCLAVDSLYFSTDLPALIDNLKSVPHIRMYLFYSQYISDPGNKDETSLQADHTRLATILRQAGLLYQTIDYSANERMLYENALDILPKFRDLFENEGNSGLYENKMKEFAMGKDLYDQGLAARYLYILQID